METIFSLGILAPLASEDDLRLDGSFTFYARRLSNKL